jgi:hypothetical protein
VQQELAVAQLELAGLINLPAGNTYRLAESSADEQLPALTSSVEELEETALLNNADLREERYNARIAVLEARKSLARLLPGLSLSYGFNHDGDDFLINKSWSEAGLGATANLVHLFAIPSQNKLRKTGDDVAQTRRMALEMALITQVHVAAYQFSSARKQFERADAIWHVDDRMLSLTQNGQAVQTESELARIASHTAAILSLLRRYQALANLHAADGKMQATLGLEPRIGSLDTLSLADLTRQLEHRAGP